MGFTTPLRGRNVVRPTRPHAPKAGLRDSAEELLREAAFVLHLTRRVKEEIIEGKSSSRAVLA